MATSIHALASGTFVPALRTMPHFYFHVVTAYDILRYQGVDIGKRDYMRHAGPHTVGARA